MIAATLLRVGAISILLTTAGCSLLYYKEAPHNRCDEPGRVEDVPCGVCFRGTQRRTCDGSQWLEEACRDNPFDLDGDGFANESCFAPGQDASCCGQPDCDDDVAERYPGALVDLDEDEHYDSRCCSLEDDRFCDDCDDDDDRRWYGHADNDEDGHVDILCGGDDCDDNDDRVWWDHADLDGDGHTDIRCCEPGALFCDDCDDNDPERWLDHADLDGDGHDASSCCDAAGVCGTDCDDSHPERWNGHADVDGDGHIDDRCCPAGEARCDDCNDSDPRRWTGTADLDGDGHIDARCRCDERNEALDCSLHDDCDDDCAECYPGSTSESYSEARDHNCDNILDSMQAPSCEPVSLEIVGSTVSTGDSYGVAVADNIAYVASVDGLYVLNVSSNEPELVSHLDVGVSRDVAVWGELVLVATARGLVVARLASSTELVWLAGPLETGDSRAVAISGGNAYVASYEGLFVVDLTAPTEPVIVAHVGEPVFYDGRGVSASLWLPAVDALLVSATGRSTTDFPDGGLGIFDVSEAHRPRLAYSLELPGARALSDLVYPEILIGVPGGLAVVSAVPPPTLARSFEAESVNGTGLAGYTDAGQRLTAGFAACADGLQSYNVFRGPMAHVDTGYSRDVFVAGGRVFVATSSGLQIVDLGCSYGNPEG